MTIKELYEQACELGVEDEELEEVEKFCKYHFSGKGGRLMAICGYCKNRKKDKCPWPTSCQLEHPACNEFENKHKVNF